MKPDWIVEARRELIELKGHSPGWSYRPGGEPSVEPSVLAALALLAEGDPWSAETFPAVRETADWIASIQASDGSVGVSSGMSRPCWPTSYALLLWSCLEGMDIQRNRAFRYLLRRQGLHWPAKKRDVSGHDTAIPGWPWAENTHSWVEPTAMAILALRKNDLADHRRVRQGTRMLLDRMIPTGGWNYGNTVVFDTVLRPRPAPTGLTLLALAGHGDARLTRSLDYLRRELPSIRSPQSLCWGLLALEAWRRPVEESARWLGEAHREIRGCSDPAVQLSFLVLAGSENSLTLLGVAPRPQEVSS